MRIAAAVRLGRPSDEAEREQALPALQRSLEDRDARVRAAAVGSLADLGGERVVPLLRERLSDTDGMVRELATLGLADLGWELAGDAILAALRSDHPEVRFQALAAAAKSGDARALSPVLRALDDDDPFVRASAVQAAGLLDEDARSPSVLAKLRLALEDPDYAVRCQAAIALAGAGDPRAADALLPALADKEHVFEALEVAPRLSDPRVREQVAFSASAVLGSRLITAAAGRALARMGDPRGIPTLRDVVGAWRTQGRTFAVQTIGELGLVDLLPEVIRLSERPRAVDPATLAESLSALAKHTPEAASALQKLAARSDEFGAAARAVRAESS